MPEPGLKSFGFGLKTLKQRPEIIPLVAIIGTACVGVAAYSVYCFVHKSDVILNRQSIPPWERIDPEKPQKLLVMNQEYKKIPEVEALKKDLATYNTAQK